MEGWNWLVFLGISWVPRSATVCLHCAWPYRSLGTTINFVSTSVILHSSLMNLSLALFCCSSDFYKLSYEIPQNFIMGMLLLCLSSCGCSTIRSHDVCAKLHVFLSIATQIHALYFSWRQLSDKTQYPAVFAWISICEKAAIILECLWNCI